MIIKASNFNLQQIADSGQCFRMNKISDNKYSLIAFNRYIELLQVDQNSIEIDCSEEEFDTIWKNYFDLEYDYNNIIETLNKGDDDFLRKAAKHGKGLRILRQELFETIISFIISQRKNIPAIKSTIERLCKKYGEMKNHNGIDFYTFPTPESLANAKKEDLRDTGLGYRDEYIIKTSKAIVNSEIDLKELTQCTFEEAIKGLMLLSGVGVKVANCVALFSLHHIDAFPIDVWIDRIITNIYQGEFDILKYQGYAGIVQQYMFYYYRNNSKLAANSILAF